MAVPSFDLRYPNECAYVVRKTLLDRWRTLEVKINRSRAAAEAAAAGGGIHA